MIVTNAGVIGIEPVASFALKPAQMLPWLQLQNQNPWNVSDPLKGFGSAPALPLGAGGP